MNYVEVAGQSNMSCCECGCSDESATMRYVYFADTEEVRAYCADDYRAWMIAIHGEETVKMLEETPEYTDALKVREV